LSGAIASHHIDVELRDWKLASDHVPVLATFGVCRTKFEGEDIMLTVLGILLIGLVIGLLARVLTPGPTPRGFLVTIVIGIAGSVLATYGGQALGVYQAGETAGFIGS